MTFEQAFKEVIGLEGNYSDDPNDPGGATKYGISKRAYPDLDIEALTLEQAQAIYHRDYWLPLRCDDLSGPVASILFKQAVNQGVSASIKRLQKVLNLSGNLSIDGVMGPKTVAAANAADPKELVVNFLSECLLAYTTLHTWEIYGRGWTRRVLNTAIGAFS